MELSPTIHRLVRLAYPYGTVRRIMRGPLRGMHFTVRPAMGLSFAWGVDSMNWRWLGPCLKPGMCVYDIGSNRGQCAMFFAQAVGAAGTVVSFEPVPAIFDDLQYNLSLNSLRNVRSICAALSDRTGHELFAFNPATDTQGKLVACEPTYNNASATSIWVATLCLDELAGRDLPPPQFLKIDVEGGAGRVLQGAQRVLEEFQPEIYIELHGPEEQTAVRDYIQRAGYTLMTLSGALVADPTAGWYSPLSCRPLPSA